MTTEEKNLKKEQDTDSFILEVEKKYGKGIIQVGDNINKNVPIICSTGSHLIDLALGCGGIPKGRIIEIYGNPSGGKTSLSIHMMREVQKVGGNVAFIDVENSFDAEWAGNLGVDINKLFVVQPDSGDQVFDICEMMIKSGNVNLIVIDSVSAMATKAELEGDYGDTHIGQLARLMSQGLKKLTAAIKKSETTVVFINQVRQRIGVMFGSPNTTSGGNALKFYASIRLDVGRIGIIGDKENPDGIESKVKVVKNKCGAPFRTAVINFYFGKDSVYGINPISEIVDIAVTNNIIQKRGAWYSYNEERIGQGRENVIAFLSKSEAMYSEIKKLVFETVMVKNKPTEGSFKDVVQKQVKEDTGNETK